MAGRVMPSVAYRPMLLADIPAGLTLCRASGWNQLAADWNIFLSLSPDGCRVAVNVDNAVVGSVTTLRYQDRFSWVAMVLVDPAHRGFGIGTALLDQALEILDGQAAVRLDATPAGQRLYRKLAFFEEYRLTRFERPPAPLSIDSAGGAIRPMHDEDLTWVLRLDSDVFGADRRVVLEAILGSAPEYAWVADVAGRITGYMFGRHGFAFEHVGPLMAQDLATAQELMLAVLGRHAGRPFIVDATHHTPDWLAWLASLGFVVQRPFVRMVRGVHRHPGRPEKLFAILGPEFG